VSRDRQRAKSYFDQLAPEYDRAFRLSGRNPLSALINRWFRGKTFVRRMRLLESLFADIDVAGKTLLDLACDNYADPMTLQQCKSLMRQLVGHYLGSRTLHTRQLLLDLQQF